MQDTFSGWKDLKPEERHELIEKRKKHRVTLS
jgi:hypothetical protein